MMLAKNDWIEIIDIFYKTHNSYLESFINSSDIFCPNPEQINLFDHKQSVFSAKQLNKEKPGNWKLGILYNITSAKIPLLHPKAINERSQL